MKLRVFLPRKEVLLHVQTIHGSLSRNLGEVGQVRNYKLPVVISKVGRTGKCVPDQFNGK